MTHLLSFLCHIIIIIIIIIICEGDGEETQQDKLTIRLEALQDDVR